MSEPNEATSHTREAQAAAAARLPGDPGADFRIARRGHKASVPDARILNDKGHPVWDLGPYAFLAEERAPDTVHPGLWRQARLNAIHGLFEVCPRIWQVRAFDISNITFIEGETGLIVIDPLISAETATAALALYARERGERPVKAVIYTHSHVDHYGGVRGVLSEEDIASERVRIIAPEGFLEAAVSENVLAGNAMGRRATYMYGALLPKGPKGHVDCGLGKSVSFGSVSLVPPTEIVSRTGTKLDIDGVEIVFQITPDTEAPAEMNFFFPQMKALCMAENCTCTLHNLYTPRGALVRDAKSWSRYIDEAMGLFLDEAEVLFASHHWPRWGREAARAFLVKQRDLYKYVHDQTLRLANHGLTPLEIAERLALPESLAAEWHTRDYYGTLSHNAKAVYQRYLGWFDGNPAHLNPLPPEEAGRRYVEFMGGAEALLKKAREAYEAGEYRWVAEVVNHLVFAAPDNGDARALQADALEQLGYRAESGPWRDFYLTGALELRQPRPKSDVPRPAGTGSLRGLPPNELFDWLSIRLNGPKAGARKLVLGVALTDLGEDWTLILENAVLHHRKGRPADPDATLSLARGDLVALLVGESSLEMLTNSNKLVIAGRGAAVGELLALLDVFDFWFEIVTP